MLVTRLPQGESIVSPRSHCRHCDHTLAWWENLPLISWLLLGGRCHSCRNRISFRYPLIELAIAALWAACWSHSERSALTEFLPHSLNSAVIVFLGYALLAWLLVALAALDAQYYWLPDRLTLPGTALGFGFFMLLRWVSAQRPNVHYDVMDISPTDMPKLALFRLSEIVLSAAIILIIRLAYWLIRRKEGMGLGDAKLMAMLGAWLGLIGAIESFALAVFAASLAALIRLAISAIRRDKSQWAGMQLPLGTFLCLAGLSEIFFPQWLWTWYSHAFLAF